MTVRELRELLARFPDDLVVYVSRDGEELPLHPGDLTTSTQVDDAGEGRVYADVAQEFSSDDDDGDPIVLPGAPGFLVIGTWS